ncbi:MAG: flagellar biosynthesis anti-sigma factor FlgM [Spirochaetales bacterium]|nr:flagellar biosynthesis anti-sigma factor FlgM [Spirochaetales bacterium]
MTIERINVPDPLSKYKKTENISKPSKNLKNDSVNISEEAKFRAKLEEATDLAKSSPAVRKDRVEEVKRKLEDPAYIDDKVIEMVADQIMKHFEI